MLRKGRAPNGIGESAVSAEIKPGVQLRALVTVAGLPGSEAEAVGAEIARIVGFRFVADDIPKMLCRRLQRSVAELAALEGSFRTRRSRAARLALAPWERYGAFEASYIGVGIWSPVDYADLEPYLTKEKYLQGLRGVIAELASEGGAVLYGNGNHTLLPTGAPALRVFVQTPESYRRQRIATQMGLSLTHAERWLRKADRERLSISKHLFGSDLLDISGYDLVVNLEGLPHEAAAESAAAALRSLVPELKPSIAPSRLSPERTPGTADGAPAERSNLMNADLFRNLTEEQILSVVSLGRFLELPAGHGLGSAGGLGDEIFVITEGTAVLSAESAIGEIVVRVAGPRESFPLAALIGTGALITSASAMTEMKLLALPLDSLTALCSREPEIGMGIYAAIADAFGHRYRKTLGRLTTSAERVLRKADFFATV